MGGWKSVKYLQLFFLMFICRLAVTSEWLNAEGTVVGEPGVGGEGVGAADQRPVLPARPQVGDPALGRRALAGVLQPAVLVAHHRPNKPGVARAAAPT